MSKDPDPKDPIFGTSIGCRFGFRSDRSHKTDLVQNHKQIPTMNPNNNNDNSHTPNHGNHGKQEGLNESPVFVETVTGGVDDVSHAASSIMQQVARSPARSTSSVRSELLEVHGSPARHPNHGILFGLTPNPEKVLMDQTHA